MSRSGPGQGFPKPGPDQGCQATTRKGSPCKNFASGLNEAGERRCPAHGGPGASLVMTDPREAKRRREAKDRRRKEEAEDQDTLRRLGLRAMTSARAERNRERLLDRLFEHAFSADARVSMQALQTIFDRVLGRPVQGTVNLSGTIDPSQINELRSQITALTPEGRLELLGQRVKQIKDAEIVEESHA